MATKSKKKVKRTIWDLIWDRKRLEWKIVDRFTKMVMLTSLRGRRPKRYMVSWGRKALALRWSVLSKPGQFFRQRKDGKWEKNGESTYGLDPRRRKG